jgi:hypothetical protein
LLDAGSHKAKVTIDTVIAMVENADPFIFTKVYINGVADNDLLDSFFNVISYYYKHVESPIKKRILALEVKNSNNYELDSLNTLLMNTELEKG